MTSKEAKIHIIDTLNGDMNKEYFINELLPEILKDLDQLEELEKAQDIEISNLKFTDNESKYQTSIRVLKEAFITLGRGDIANTCWFKYLEELEKENQELREDKKALIKNANCCDWHDCIEITKENEKLKKENQELKDKNEVLEACIKDWEDDYEHLEFYFKNREKALEILKKYLYYDNKNHAIKMKEVRKSIYNFDYEDLKEMLENE